MATKEQSLSDLVFVPYKIISRETAFNSTFSEVQIGIEPFKKPSTDLSIGFEFPSFFLQDEDEENKCPKVDCILSGALESEASMFHNVMTDFVQELGRVTLNRDYESGPARLRDYQRFFSDDYTPRGITDTSASGRVMYGPIGIGERGVWWGEPDACVRPLNSDDHDPSDSTVFVATSSEAESDSESSQFKAKQEIERSHLPQAIAIAIVHSFTQSNRHPMLNPMVPTILMNGYKFQIILYDCHNDVLLVSTTVEYKINDRITTLGTQILWNIINHRKFLNTLDDTMSQYASGLRELAEKENVLALFTGLDATCIAWRQMKRKPPDSPEGMTVGFPKFKPRKSKKTLD